MEGFINGDITTLLLFIITLLLAVLSFLFKRYLIKTDEKFNLLFDRMHDVESRCVSCANIRMIEKLIPLINKDKKT